MVVDRKNNALFSRLDLY